MSVWLIPFLALLLGLWWMHSERTLIIDGLRSYSWHRAKGRIIDREDRSFLIPGIVGSAGTGVGLEECRETGYYYEFQVGMTRYVSDVYCFGVHIDKEVARYLVGDHVSVYFDPQNPRRSVLRRGVRVGTMVSVVPVLVGASFLIWRLCA